MAKKLEDTKGVTRSRTSKNVRQYNGQKLEDTKGVTRNRTSKKVRQYDDQKLEDTRGVTRNRTSKKVRQYNGQKKKRKNNDLQNTTQIAEHEPHEKRGSTYCSTSSTPHVTLVSTINYLCLIASTLTNYTHPP